MTTATISRQSGNLIRWVEYALLGILLLTGALLPIFTDRDNILNLGYLVLLNICLSQSWNILGGFTGQTSLGHAAFFGIGALSARFIWLSWHLPIVAAMVAGGAAAALFAMIIGAPTFRLRGAYFAIGTLALGQMLFAFVAQTLPFIDTMPGAQIGMYSLANRYYLAFALVLTVMGVTLWLLRQPISLGLLAVREDEEAARATGVDPLRHKLFALALSALFTGMTGGLFAYHQISYYPEATFGIHWTFDAVLITYIGGLGSWIGPVIGSLFFVALREWLASTFASLNLIIFGALFIAVVLVLPGGLVEIWHWIQRRLSQA
ncbi:MAG: branched-chain amino acid ABC transporter permease [Caldilineaceae bacterium]|nr:branched-chain amino acid ABC transporter permease [Caldilineaceae bacterium]MCB0140656.1 branched-chain amino acid ABC transporter permease [Caldilineaceae bacterium]MCB9156258.1 branched-chain amino acid ABC transporter permease [Caldilineaceae bacterium]